MAMGRVGSCVRMKATWRFRKSRMGAIASPTVKKGSLLALQTTMDGWLRWMRTISSTCCSTLASNSGRSAGSGG